MKKSKWKEKKERELKLKLKNEDLRNKQQQIVSLFKEKYMKDYSKQFSQTNFD